jgi:hypothetical protein
MRLPVLLFFLTFLSSLHAQRCPCTRNLDFTITKTERNYAGFQDKVTTATRREYQTHTDSCRLLAAQVQSDSACRRLCYKWLRWFKDGHISMRPYGSSQMLAGTPPPFAVSELDSQTVLLTLPSMSNSYRALVDSMLRTNALLLNAKPYLIIDCRNNGGGSDNTWEPLKPYLITQPVLTDGRQYWASEDNAAFLMKMAQEEGVGKSQRRYLKSVAAEMKKQPGRFVGTMNARRERFTIATANPRKVAILVNNKSASSTENLLLWAHQSKKVTIFGRQTAGIADYGNLSVSVAPCRDWELWLPVMRSNRVADGRGLDNKGFTPDVLPEGEEAGWIEYARKWLRDPTTESPAPK